MARKVFKAGDPKPENSGRKKGTPNKRTVEQREAYEEIMLLLEKRMRDGNDVIDNLSPARAAELYNNLLAYKKPKMTSTKIEGDVQHSGNVSIVIRHSDKSGGGSK